MYKMDIYELRDLLGRFMAATQELLSEEGEDGAAELFEDEVFVEDHIESFLSMEESSLNELDDSKEEESN